MTPDEINAAIAEWMGWDGLAKTDFDVWVGIPPRLRTRPINMGDVVLNKPIPNFYGDLNEIKKALGTLENNHTTCDFPIARFIGHLEAIVSRKGIKQGWSWPLINAEAHELCEALLRTVYLWRKL